MGNAVKNFSDCHSSSAMPPQNDSACWFLMFLNYKKIAEEVIYGECREEF
jgi:hypothetical protein